MAGIYRADIYCDDCIDQAKDSIADVMWHDRALSVTPDGERVSEFASCKALNDYLRGMDERTYDSDEYPKWCSDDEESDCPQHCGNHEDCVNCEQTPDGFKYGCFLGNDLTSAGAEYVKETVQTDLREGYDDSVAVMVWKPFYDYIDYEEEGDE